MKNQIAALRNDNAFIESRLLANVPVVISGQTITIHEAKQIVQNNKSMILKLSLQS